MHDDIYVHLFVVKVVIMTTSWLYILPKQNKIYNAKSSHTLGDIIELGLWEFFFVT